MSSRNDCNRARMSALRMSAISTAIIGAFALPTAVSAFEIPTGNDDLVLRWDNTFRLNIAQRVQGQDVAILRAVNNDDGDRNFNRGRTFSRLDVLSEFDIVWRKQLGFRVSGAGWSDPAYDRLNNSSVATSNVLVNGRPVVGELPNYSKRYAEGVSGEWLDVFGFASIDAGGIPINMKLGQTTVYWGESLLGNGAVHGVSYSQNPLDQWKAAATPGAEAKELFRPRVGFNIQSQVTQDLSLAAQYFFNWQRFSNQAVRYPEAATYLSISDALNWGGQSLIIGANPLAPGQFLRAWRGTDIEPDENKGNYGLAARWSPDWADATIGAYYRRTYDDQPQIMLTPGISTTVPAATCSAIGGIPLPPTGAVCIINRNATTPTDLVTYGKAGLYNTAYGTDIDIFGVSLSKNIAGVSVGAELSYRRNMPLLSDPVQVVPAALVASVPGSIATTAVPTNGTPGALGTTMHGLINGLMTLAGSRLFDSASLAAELTWMTWLDVSQNEAVFKGRNGYTAIDRVNKNYFGLAINFTPTWFQVFPGVDLLAPLSWAGGISGNSAVTAGGQENSGNFGIGVAADIYQRYRIDLKYVGYYGRYSVNAAGAATVFNGSPAILSDRDFVALTFKTTF